MEPYQMPTLRTVKRFRSSRVSQRQLDIMISFMEANDDLRYGKLSASFTKSDRKRKWNELTNILNTEGPVRKTADQWRKSWNDQKAYARHKAVKIRSHGGNPDYEESLSPTEERILSTTRWVPPDDGFGDIDGSNIQDACYPIQNSQLCETSLIEYDNDNIEEISEESDDVLKLLIAKNSPEKLKLSEKLRIIKKKAAEQNEFKINKLFAHATENDPQKLELSRKLTVITKKLTEQNELLQRIIESNEKIASACVLIASNSDKRVKEHSEQTTLMREIQGTMRLQSCLFSDMEKAFKEMISQGENHQKLPDETPVNSQTTLKELNVNRVDVLSADATLKSDDPCYIAQIKVEMSPEDEENHGNKVMEKAVDESIWSKNNFLTNGIVKDKKPTKSDSKFERFLVTEMKSLSKKPKLFIQTKQAILKILGRAHNELMNTKQPFVLSKCI